MANYIQEQKNIIDKKIETALANLSEQLSTINISNMYNKESFFNYLKYLSDKQKFQVRDYIYENYNLDTSVNIINDMYKNSIYTEITFELIGYFDKKSNQFDTLRQEYLQNNLGSFESLPTS